MNCLTIKLFVCVEFKQLYLLICKFLDFIVHENHEDLNMTSINDLYFNSIVAVGRR